ncbi:MAG: hypothetical protein GY802_09110, partial [Gammaproteobacteria bacterium]|nr:hypothetical protein [Gammaproteobacteria bacterium]
SELRDPTSSVLDSIRLSAEHWDKPRPDPFIYQGVLDPDRVQVTLKARLQREKQQLRLALARMAEEHSGEPADTNARIEADEPTSRKFDLTTEQNSQPEFELEGMPMPQDNDVKSLVTSIMQDLGEMPPDYLQAAGSGEYHDSLSARAREDHPDDVCKGAYHEKGAFLYDEWDCTRKAHRKRWCAVREREI